MDWTSWILWSGMIPTQATGPVSPQWPPNVQVRAQTGQSQIFSDVVGVWQCVVSFQELALLYSMTTSTSSGGSMACPTWILWRCTTSGPTTGPPLPVWAPLDVTWVLPFSEDVSTPSPGKKNNLLIFKTFKVCVDFLRRLQMFSCGMNNLKGDNRESFVKAVNTTLSLYMCNTLFAFLFLFPQVWWEFSPEQHRMLWPGTRHLGGCHLHGDAAVWRRRVCATWEVTFAENKGNRMRKQQDRQLVWRCLWSWSPHGDDCNLASFEREAQQFGLVTPWTAPQRFTLAMALKEASDTPITTCMTLVSGICCCRYPWDYFFFLFVYKVQYISTHLKQKNMELI